MMGQRHSGGAVRFSIAAVVIGLVAAGSAVRAIEIGDGELRITPRVTAGAVSWDELRGRGGHKSIGGLRVDADYRVDRIGVNLDLWKWWVAEGLDFNKGTIPKDGHRVGLELRRVIGVNEALSWYPYAGVAYEEWNRHSVPDKWRSLDFLSGVVGAGVEHDKAYAKLGLSHPFTAHTDRGSDPSGRVGFESEVGLRLSAVTIGLFWRGAGFQEPDAKLIKTGAFVGYRF
ncbi:MAG: hypothetical protein GX595_02770 [Lentisphaerae bacterium]|nr:hypothetical protein [Lentisphaerota bacterium]